jgi:membrane-anchored protein YejM (alkaline phosphatase superfamily)
MKYQYNLVERIFDIRLRSPQDTPRRKWRLIDWIDENEENRRRNKNWIGAMIFHENWKIPKRVNFEMSPRDFQAEYQKSVNQIVVLTPMVLHAKNEEDLLENKKMSRSDVLAKLGKRKNGQRLLSRPVFVRYFHIFVHYKIARTA